MRYLKLTNKLTGNIVVTKKLDYLSNFCKTVMPETYLVEIQVRECEEEQYNQITKEIRGQDPRVIIVGPLNKDKEEL
jgi:hypothetical protein